MLEREQQDGPVLWVKVEVEVAAAIDDEAARGPATLDGPIAGMPDTKQAMDVWTPVDIPNPQSTIQQSTVDFWNRTRKEGIDG